MQSKGWCCLSIKWKKNADGSRTRALFSSLWATVSLHCFVAISCTKISTTLHSKTNVLMLLDLFMLLFPVHRKITLTPNIPLWENKVRLIEQSVMLDLGIAWLNTIRDISQWHSLQHEKTISHTFSSHSVYTDVYTESVRPRLPTGHQVCIRVDWQWEISVSLYSCFLSLFYMSHRTERCHFLL